MERAGDREFRDWDQERELALQAQSLSSRRRLRENTVGRDDIRLLVKRMTTAIDDATVEIEPDAMGAWRKWALAEADRLDPLLSGQVFKHLGAPTGADGD